MYEGPGQPQQESNRNLYVLLGCAGMLVVGLCAATGYGVYIMTAVDPGYASPPVVPAPAPAPVQAPAAVPLPPGANQPPGPALPPPPGPALPPPPNMGMAPRVVEAEVSATSGSAPVGVGTTCTFSVERHSRSAPPGYWCRTQIACGGQLLYGGPSAGYFECTLGAATGVGMPSIVGADTTTTAADTDAAMSIDTTSQTVSIRDDVAGQYGVYTVDLRILSVR